MLQSGEGACSCDHTHHFLCCFFGEVEESLDLKKLTGWLDEMKETTVSVHLPRFRVEDSFSLKEKLQNLGLTDLFSPGTASLPGERRINTHLCSTAVGCRMFESCRF